MFRSLFIAVSALLFASSLFADTKSPILPDTPQPAELLNATLITEVSAKGQKVSAIALEYEDNLLTGAGLQHRYQIEVFLDGQSQGSRHIIKSYTLDKASRSNMPKAGKFLILELDKEDKNADLYSLKTENSTPMSFRAKNESGENIVKEIVQSNRVPEFYQERLQYVIQQQGLIKLSNGKTVSPTEISVSANPQHRHDIWIDHFSAQKIQLKQAENNLLYRIYQPQTAANKKYPLVLFLHGSGQLGSDNIAQLLSSRGAISTLDYEESFILAPQYTSVFDPFDDYSKGQRGGIHWQTENRRELLLTMIDQTIKENPNIDSDRIYLIGLSRGAEGALYLLLDRPDFFAGALLMSGREAHTVEWLDGNANKDNMATLAKTPIWFFHSKEDKVSPVSGSRINYQILTQQLNNPFVRYTEFSFEQAGDNGIINNNPHNTWDAVFNSPEAIQWLLQQTKH